MRIRRSRRLLVAVPVLLAVVTSCGTAGTAATHSGANPAATGTSAAKPAATHSASSATAASSVSVHPGRSTPQDAVDGYLKALLAGHWATACSYLLPNMRSKCRSAAASLPGPPKGHFAIGHVAVSGIWAVVAVTGHACFPASGCQSNTNPSAGLPVGSESITKAIAKAQAANGFSPVPCVREGSKWDIYLAG